MKRQERTAIDMYLAYKLFQRTMDEGMNNGLIKHKLKQVIDNQMKPFMKAVEDVNDMGDRGIDFVKFSEGCVDFTANTMDNFVDNNLIFED